MRAIMRSLCIISIWSLHIHAAESEKKNQASHYPGDCIIDLLPKLQEYENKRSKNKPPKPYDMWYCPSPLSSPIPKIETVAEDEKKDCWQDGDLGLIKTARYIGVDLLDLLNGRQKKSPHKSVDTKASENQRRDHHWTRRRNATCRARMQRCRKNATSQ